MFGPHEWLPAQAGSLAVGDRISLDEAATDALAVIEPPTPAEEINWQVVDEHAYVIAARAEMGVWIKFALRRPDGTLTDVRLGWTFDVLRYCGGGKTDVRAEEAPADVV